MTKLININADLGESYGIYTIGRDEELLEIVRSANVACAYHAGDPDVMRTTVRRARENGVSIGAHPSFPDHKGFGRRAMSMTSFEVENMVAYQIGSLMAVAALEGARVTHVKPHGALNNLAAEDEDLARALAAAIKGVDRDLVFLAPCGSAMVRAGRAAGLPVAEEAFADRAYTDAGTLVPRSQAGAMIDGAEAAVRHVLRMVEEQALVSLSGKRIPARVDSICVHGDGAEAVEMAKAVRDGLQGAGYAVVPLPKVLGATAA